MHWVYIEKCNIIRLQMSIGEIKGFDRRKNNGVIFWKRVGTEIMKKVTLEQDIIENKVVLAGTTSYLVEFQRGVACQNMAKTHSWEEMKSCIFVHRRRRKRSVRLRTKSLIIFHPFVYYRHSLIKIEKWITAKGIFLSLRLLLARYAGIELWMNSIDLLRTYQVPCKSHSI